MNDRCHALQKNGKCRAIDGHCPGYELCAFYKPLKQYEQDQQLTYQRLAGLPKEQQDYIADRYYRGKMPWEAEGR